MREEATSGVQLLVCAGCRRAAYCTAEHQKACWRAHRKQCGVLPGGVVPGQQQQGGKEGGGVPGQGVQGWLEGQASVALGAASERPGGKGCKEGSAAMLLSIARLPATWWADVNWATKVQGQGQWACSSAASVGPSLGTRSAPGAGGPGGCATAAAPVPPGCLPGG